MKIQRLSPEYLQETKNLIDVNFQTKIKMEVLEDTILNPVNATYILTNKNEVIATVGIRDINRICWLCTKVKRKGYARRLMHWIIRNIENPYLFVKQNNLPAIELYKSLGFIVVGTKENSYRMEI